MLSHQNYKIVLQLSFILFLLVPCKLLFASGKGGTTTGTTTSPPPPTPIDIVPISPLAFPTAVQGDPAYTVPPGTGETPENASFLITGEPNTAYSITLPPRKDLLSSGGGSGANDKVSLDLFTSFPPGGANGLLDAGGSQVLYIGATRGAIRSTQTPGAYIGDFIVEVVY